ncbi:hypothetical protein MNBD_GAMMA12-575 [hydrothermal vent metagenome]|uniref:Uncharacterized protein n=1 Tax=hydrothermal vent metagenome TaxID=652676 RepID=A0A3B0YP36_9ZZZZ
MIKIKQEITHVFLLFLYVLNYVIRRYRLWEHRTHAHQRNIIVTVS